jgi:signal transduction histidine kinase
MEGWEMVQQGIDDMTEMSRSMLDFARTRKMNVKPTDLGELAQKIHHLNRSKFKEDGVALELDVSPDLPLVECDGEMIRSVIMDLTGNALDACSWKEYKDGEVPRVTMGVHRGEMNGRVEIVVKDNGVGMTEEVRGRVFTPFFSTKEKKGTGMGLAVVARIVSSHEGRTAVESEPGKGATFRVSLPIEGPNLREEGVDA